MFELIHRPDLLHEADVALLSTGKGTSGDRHGVFAVTKEEECRQERDDDAKKDAPDIAHDARGQLSGLPGCPLRRIPNHRVEVDAQSSGLAMRLGDELVHWSRSDRAGEVDCFVSDARRDGECRHDDDRDDHCRACDCGPRPPHPTLEPHLERMKDDGHHRGEYECDGEWLEDEKQHVGEKQNRHA
jgi:hypothetical protein